MQCFCFVQDHCSSSSSDIDITSYDHNSSGDDACDIDVVGLSTPDNSCTDGTSRQERARKTVGNRPKQLLAKRAAAADFSEVSLYAVDLM